MAQEANRLIYEKSPYLLQHAHNPVDWYPWGQAAFDRATREDKPIFLSIGYSTCHWCHVMERESFEDPEVASLMNQDYVSVKVDREERPDVDSTYMDACQMMTGSGGWPLTIIMRPDRKPFFAGTYIPRDDRFGMLGMKHLLKEIANAWRDRREDIDSVAEMATSTIADHLSHDRETVHLDRRVMDGLYSQLTEEYDSEHGGFGHFPKFPIPHKMLFLLRYWKRTGEGKALTMVEETLIHMMRGGIHDQVGGGFHRYSTDRIWLVPHFEKMLYDQALLTMAYSEAFQATRRREFRRTASGIIDYVLGEMTSPEGAFCSAEDADSEGEEGMFYIWTLDEVREVLGNEGDLMIEAFNVLDAGNYLDESSRGLSGRNILHMDRGYKELAEERGVTIDELFEVLDGSLARLRDHRKGRIRPLRDDKILADWNGLMVAALARASWMLDRSDCLEAAERAASFILDRMSGDGLRHRFREGEISREVFLQDYSFLIWGLAELYQSTFDVRWLREALHLMDSMVDMFWNSERGWFQLSPRGREEMIFQKMDSYDGAVPSGNSAAFLDLIMLSRITGRAEWEDIAQRLSDSYSPQVLENPQAYALFLSGLDLALGPSSEVVITGDLGSEGIRRMVSAIRERYLPGVILLLRREGLEELVPYTSIMDGDDGKVLAYVCSGKECRMPVDSVEDMMELIESKSSMEQTPSH